MLTRHVTPLSFPPDILRFGLLFKSLQDKRHAADYDPWAVVDRSDVLGAIQDAEEAIKRLDACAAKDKRALAILILLGKPRP
jgi:hypothetical protein